jgi:hypothetical protein
VFQPPAVVPHDRAHLHVVLSRADRTIQAERPPKNWRFAVEKSTNFPPATPEDATKASAEQRELQEKLDHKDDDPDAPARSQTYRQIPDEN